MPSSGVCEGSVVNYYNDNDPYCAVWLRNLITADLIPDGDVDDRGIEEVTASDVQGYTQCHFFAGIAGWSEALRLAGWPTTEPVWTGSCPCQPFSVAGRGRGEEDERHLWPEFRRLIAECRPPVIFGEQVAGKAGREWLGGVRQDLTRIGYTVAAADLCASSVGAPHIRQRLFWVACNDTSGTAYPGTSGSVGSNELCTRILPQMETLGYAVGAADLCAAGVGSPQKRQRLWWVADSGSERLPERAGVAEVSEEALESPSREAVECRCASGGVGDADSTGPQPGEQTTKATGYGSSIESASSDDRVVDTDRSRCEQPENEVRPGRNGFVGAGFWDDFEFIECADGRQRRIEPGTFPLAVGFPDRVGKLRAYGNAIVPQVAGEFVRAYMEACGGIVLPDI